ncbi:hypothetical protein [Pendulispora albinea]|uniref:WD40 repeat protein n=1 Tax=Pendulispora albinea TaxID=2741071 RepID=A0ABZ2M9Z8_9BACT
MSRRRSRLSLVATASMLAACSGGGGGNVDTATAEESPLAAADRGRDVLLQAGTAFIPLAVTDDDYAFYQDGRAVYVSALRAGAPRTKLADVPGDNTAFIYISGKVAFIWTNPDYALPGFGVSPLVVWTAAHGARAASASSAVGTLVTTASDDGRRIVFPTHSDAAGSVGDLVLASADLAHTETLVRGANMSFPAGACRPEATFLGHGDDAYPATAACIGDEPTATLTTWRNGVRRDVHGIFARPRLFVDPHRSHIATLRREGAGPTAPTPVLITENDVRPIDTVPSSLAFFAADGALLYTDKTVDPTVPGMHLRRTVRAGHGAITVVPTLASVYGFGAGSESIHAPPTSRDGRWLLYAANADPQTGLTDLHLADLHARACDPRTFVLDGTLANTTAGGNPFTDDARFVVTNHVTDPATGAGPLVATRLADRSHRNISDDLPARAIPAAGSFVTVGDHFELNASNVFLSTVDVKLVDLAAARDGTTVIATNARLNFFVNRTKTRIIYATDEAGRAGLRAARVR